MTAIELDLDVSKPQSTTPQIICGQGDDGLSIRASIFDNGMPVDFERRYVELCMLTVGGTWIRIVDGVGQIGNSNTWIVPIPVQATAEAGFAKVAYLNVRDMDDETYRVSTGRFCLKVEPSATYDADISPYADEVDKLIAQINGILSASSAQMEGIDDRYEMLAADLRADFNLAESRRDEIAQEAKRVIEQAALDNLDPIQREYIEVLIAEGALIAPDNLAEETVEALQDLYLDDYSFISEVTR